MMTRRYITGSLLYRPVGFPKRAFKRREAGYSCEGVDEEILCSLTLSHAIVSRKQEHNKTGSEAPDCLEAVRTYALMAGSTCQVQQTQESRIRPHSSSAAI